MDDLEDLDLSSIVTRLQNIGSGEENIAPWKRVLCLLVARVTDCKDVSSSASENEREVCLEFINYCLSNTPQMFQNLLEENSDGVNNSADNDTNSNVSERRFDLVYWVMNRLVFMLTKLERENSLNGTIIDILIHLAQNVGLKDCSSFSKLSMSYIQGLSKLCELSEQMYSSEEDDIQFELKDLCGHVYQSADGSGEAKMTHKPLVLNSQDDCESLQIVFTKILTKLAVNTSLFTLANPDGHLDSMNVLWISIASQLEWGEVELKTVSLKLANKLLLYSKPPSGQSLDYFMDCLLGLLDLLCSGFDDCEGDYNTLEETVKEGIEQMVKYCLRPEITQSLTHLVFSHMAKNIMKSLTNHGSLNLRTKNLRQSLFDSLIQICNIEKGLALVQSLEEERKELNRVIIDEIGFCEDSEYCVRWLRNSVLIDVYSKYDSSDRSSSICTLDSILGVAEIENIETEEKEEKIPTKRKKLTLSKGSNVEEIVAKGMENEDQEEKMIRKRKIPGNKSPNVEDIVVATCSLAKSHTAVLVNTKLLTQQQWVRENNHGDLNYKHLFEGVKVCLEVLVWITVKIVDQEVIEESSNSSGFLSEANILALLSMWKNFITCDPGSSELSLLASCYGKIVDGISCLLFANDVLKLSGEMFQTITWILTMYWLPAEMSWMDLRPSEHKDVTKICNKLADKLNSGVIEKCIFILAFIPKEVACKWRTHVLKVAMNDTEESVRRSAIQSFPYFLYYMGPNSNHLVYDVLHGLVKDKSIEVLIALADLLGPLSCVVSRKVMLNRNLKNEDLSSAIKCIEIKCVSCDEIDVVDETLSTRDRPKTVDPNMFFPFIELSQASQHVDVRKHLVQSLERLFGHINVRSNSDGSASMLVSQCMHLLSDPDNTTRTCFSKPLKYLLSKGGSETIVPAEVLIIEEMKKVVRAARKTKNNALMESVLRTTGHLAKHAEDFFLVLMVIVLLDNICKPLSPLVGSIAHNQLKLVAKAKNIELCHLFVQFGKKFCKVVVDNMYESEETNSAIEPLDIVKEVVDGFEFESISQFFKKTEPYLLPHLVKKGNGIGTKMIKMVAKQLGDPNHKGPVYRNIGHIYCHIVCSTESDEFTRLCKYLEEILQKPLVEFLSAGKNMEFDLLLRLASHKNQVLRGFRFYHSSLDEQVAEEISTDEGIARILTPKLLGLFVHLDNYLNNGTVEILEKKRAYESLVTLIELMGPSRITAVRVRMMTTLKIGLKFKDWGFPELCCRAWNCFVRSIDIGSVGSMLSQIIVNLLPLLQQMPKQVADIFNYLIVDNRSELSDHFHELYFIPNIPELKDVNAVLKHYTEGRYSVKDIKVQIESLLKGISHESKDVRQHALTKLQTLLHTNKSVLHTYILGSENVHPIISKIVYALLAGCRDSAPSLRVLYGACLGELGAVDQGRLQLLTNKSREDLQIFQAAVDEPLFCFDLICKLSQAYLSAVDRSVQDSVAYAIQSLIQIYEVTDDPNANSTGYKIWRKFSEEVQEVIMPLMTSRYMMTLVYTWDNLHKPIYRGGRKGFTFDSWVCTLTTYLGSCIDGEKPNKVFDACRGVLKTNTQISLYLLPYVIVHVLLEDNDQYVTEIINEMLAVLNHAKDPETCQSNASNLSHLSTQTIFSVLDHLVKWTRHRVMVLSTMAAASARSRTHMAELNYKNDGSYQRIKGFLDQIPLDTLALASFNCGAYTRSLMHYEQFIKSRKEDLRVEEHLDFMQKVFVALDEPDGVAGITAIKQTQPTLREQIMAYESVGKLSDALVCYDRAVKLDPQDLALRQGLLKCRLTLGELNSAMEQANGIIVERPEWTEQLNEVRVEAAWKLGQWDKLQSFLKPESQGRKWNVCLGKIFLAAKNGDREDFNNQVHLSRSELMGPLCAASMEFGSYQRGYEYIVQLHMLNEMEQGLRILFDLECDVDLNFSQNIPRKDLLKQWDQRIQLAQSSFRVQEPILNLRRAILGLAREVKGMEQLDQEIGHSWLQTVRIARDSGLVQAAHSSLLSASSYNLPEFCIENAKWLWHRGDFDRAQVCLEKAVEEYYPDRAKFIDGEGTAEERFACARVMLLLGTYREQTASLESTAMMRQFKEVSKIYGKWEDAYFTCAKYFDKVMTNVIAEKPEKKGDFIIHVVTNLGQSLQYGSQYIYQSMPRMLSLWLDYGAELKEPERYGRNESLKQAMEGVLNLLNNKIGAFTKQLPAYQFLTAFPQLISRICHAHPDVFSKLKDMISNLLMEYQHQAMWGMMAVSKSSYQMRNKRCQEIFHQAKSMKPELNKFLLDSHKLTERLLDLCNRSVEQSVNTLSITQHFKPLQRLVDDQEFSSIMLPLQSLMTVTLPTSTLTASEKHNPFPGEPVYIRGLEDTVELLSSLQRPKKVNLRGSDGRNFIMLCKPKDDLRKDARLMEFNSVVNKCLHKDPEASRRDLHIRTFAVTPLNEECGMLEWVPNTASLRYILNKLYRERGVYTTSKDLRSMQLPPNAPLQKKLDMFRNKLLPRHLALFSEWFLKTFPDPTSWYNARLSYCRTAAVMSMVGYILGLGDRHGENILLDSTTGDCVHVDFNCLFNKGETFDYPEIVPFRLTHNMIDAMGPLGFEGVFRRACEVCLRNMRDQSDSLMSVLKSFIYDPLVEWSKPSKGRSNPTETGETRNEKAQTHVSNIESRLKGIVKTKSKLKGLPLSVEGHVNHLVKEATDENNLCQMYIGWAPYL